MLPALALVAAALTGTALVSDRTEVRLRSPGASPERPSADVETVPTLRLDAASRELLLGVEYAPRMSLWDATDAARSLVLLHTGAASAQWIAPGVRLSLRETGSYGRQNFASLVLLPRPEGAPPGVDVVPSTTTIPYGSSTTELVAVATRGRLVLSTSIGWQMSGGLSDAARRVLLFQSGPIAQASAEVAVSRVDRLATTLAASESSFSSGAEAMFIEVREGVAHTFSRSTDGRVGVGASEARSRAATRAPNEYALYPVAEASIARRWAGRSEHGDVRLFLRLGPTMNRILGLVDQRVAGTVAASYTLDPFTLGASASGAQSVPASQAAAVRLAQGDVTIVYRASAAVSVDVGIRMLWQTQTGTDSSGAAVAPASFLQTTQTVGFVGLTVHAPGARF